MTSCKTQHFISIIRDFIPIFQPLCFRHTDQIITCNSSTKAVVIFLVILLTRLIIFFLWDHLKDVAYRQGPAVSL